ncbi:MAG: glycine--tRNA ligase subunit beta [Desulfobacteraceae bacterium]|nr:glycine--tRNA ligase subunit beta [Desulfobacteraceae bacterium]
MIKDPMKDLLFEIGTEEIPAGYIQPALESLAVILAKELDESRIAHGPAKTYGTPRRLAVIFGDVADRQETVSEEVAGPPERIGFDASGNCLVPALKFAEKTGISPRKLYVKDTPKGRYVFARVTRKGMPTRTVLKSILPEVIKAIPFPKTMRWGSQSISFARPIQSLVCLLGKQTVVFELGNLKSGRHTFGHRFMNPGKIKIESPEQYVDLLAQAHVMVDGSLRRKRIESDIAQAAKGIDGSVLADDALLDIVTHLVEYPAVAVGKFDDKFLALPDEILITAMREHQKYFAVAGPEGKLMPHFIVMNNTPAKDMKLVAKGHERVLRARLEDAMFFFRNDGAAPLESNVEKLKDVLFQAKLGSLYDKTIRVRDISGFLADQLLAGPEETTVDNELRNDVLKAAWLCKADLVSHVVVEFPKLQGIMGRIYAARNAMPENVSMAIEEHYRPTYSGGALPSTHAGAVLAVADKMDSICGCFSVGLIPSGTSDPYALRRQGIGIIQILLSKGFMISLSRLIQTCLVFFIPGDVEKRTEVLGLVLGFLKDRMANLLAEEGYSKDVIAAVMAVSGDCVPELWKKTSALDELKKEPDFEPLAAAFKRVVNIIKKSSGGLSDGESGAVKESLFEHPSEGALYQAFEKVREEARACLEKQDFRQALMVIASLKAPVDSFFNDVLVMAEDVNVRNNRLALLAGIASLFETIADFSKLSTP